MNDTHHLIPRVIEHFRRHREEPVASRDLYVKQLETIGDELAILASGAVFYSNDGHADTEDQRELDILIAEWDELRGHGSSSPSVKVASTTK